MSREPIPPEGALLIPSEAERLKQQALEEKRRENNYRKLQLSFNAILMIATVIAAGVATYQGCVMREQLSQMKVAIAQTATVIEQYKAQTKAAQESARASVQALSASERSFSLQAQLFAIEERPYLFATKFETGDVTNGKPAIVNVTIENLGKTIAQRIFTGDKHLIIAESESEAIASRLKDTVVVTRDPGPGMYLPPGKQVFISVASPVLTVEDMLALLSERKRMYAVGTIIYFDGAGRKHTSEWCSFAYPQGKSWAGCRQHTRVD